MISAVWCSCWVSSAVKADEHGTGVSRHLLGGPGRHPRRRPGLPDLHPEGNQQHNPDSRCAVARPPLLTIHAVTQLLTVPVFPL
jgi:hypothetical protein